MAQMTRTKYGNVDLDYVLGIGGFDLERSASCLTYDNIQFGVL